MASLLRRIQVPSSIKIKNFCSAFTIDEYSLDHATGIEKRELLAFLSGDPDPWGNATILRGPSTKDCPTEVPSAMESRVMACMCNEEQNYFNYMVLYKGQPKRCECGYWFVLVHKAPV